MRQVICYGIVGVTQIVVDWATFVALSSMGAGTVLANLSGRVTGATVGFSMNGRYTFGGTGRRNLTLASLLRFSVSWALMACFSTFFVALADHQWGLDIAWVLKPVLDAVIAVAGFLVSKHWIYK